MKIEIIDGIDLTPTGVVYPIIELTDGNLTHEKYSDGREYWYTDGKLTHKKYADGRHIINNIEYTEAKKGGG